MLGHEATSHKLLRENSIKITLHIEFCVKAERVAHEHVPGNVSQGALARFDFQLRTSRGHSGVFMWRFCMSHSLTQYIVRYADFEKKIKKKLRFDLI